MVNTRKRKKNKEDRRRNSKRKRKKKTEIRESWIPSAYLSLELFGQLKQLDNESVAFQFFVDQRPLDPVLSAFFCLRSQNVGRFQKVCIQLLGRLQLVCLI